MDDQNNNDVEKFIKKGVKKTANFIKKETKKAIKKLLMKNASVVVAIILVVIIILIIICSCVDYLDIINGLFPGSEDDPDYNEYCPLAYFNNIYVTDDGTLMAATSVEDMWNNDDRYGKYLSSIDSLAYLLNAQVVSQYPYIESADNDQLNGTVKFYRNNAQSPMKYVSQDTLDGYVSSYNNSR